ncbi:hypothetical protein SLEP1_g1886 [Rubroshorea leprosula]|uniref:P-type H(+)-exporting transporter n=1 Tax=Rubroshorea leprosula TaxID=152421 RepID=A0AAV5HLW4_9ROSI|nr:hypothetical protein SLEP1_g1886 [Rubroshorea leprosula]
MAGDRAISLEEIKTQSVDLEWIPVEEVLEQLKCTRAGLTSEEGARRLQVFGPNKLEEKKESMILKFLGLLWNPLSWVMEAAAIMAIVMVNGGGRPPNWQEFVGIVALLLINSTISFIEENKAGNAAAALMAGLAPKTKVLRDGRWSEQDASILVPGDIITVKLGDIIPADARLLEGGPLKIDQSALTGESLPVIKSPSDEVFSGSICIQGEIEAVVIATGVHSFLGKAEHLVDRTNQVGHFQKVLTAIGNFCICSIFIGLFIEAVVMYGIQHRNYRDGIDNLLVLLIGGTPIAMPTVLSATMSIGSQRLSQQDKRTALTYIDSNGNWHRASKGAPEQVAVIFLMLILDLCNSEGDVRRKVHAVVDQFAERVFRSLAVAIQEIPEKTKDSSGEPWQFIGLLPLFDPPRHDSAETIRMAKDLGVNVKMITGDQLAIAKETGRRLGMGTDMYSSSSLFFEDKDALLAGVFTKNEFIEMADGFAGTLQERKHICGMTGDNDAPALKKADIGIAVANASDAARSASDIVLTEPGLSVIISAVLTSRAIYQRMKNYTIYAVSATIHILFSFLIIARVWKFDFAPFMVLIIAILNDGTIMTIPRDRVKLSPQPDSWKLREIFTTGIVLGGYLAVVTVLFFWAIRYPNFFSDKFQVIPLRQQYSLDVIDQSMVMAALYLQVSIVSQALIFVTRSQSWSYVERPGLLLVIAFILTQLVATLIAVYANWDFAKMKGIGWRWAGVIWLYSVVTYIPLDILKFAIQYLLGSNVRDTLLQDKTATKNPFSDKNSCRKLPEIAEEVERRAEVIRLRELTRKGHVESAVELKGLDIDMAAFDASTMENFLQELDKEKPVGYTAQQLDDFTRNYSKRLGSGAYGDVYEGQFPNGVKIAVKLLKEKYEGAAKKQFMAEIDTIGRTNHINLKEMIEWEKLHVIAVGTAQGIAYLHQGCQQRIIHYDIKPANILLDANFLPKVADFGLAKLCSRDSTHDSVTGFKGTLGYSAPELFLRNHPVTYKCDVYSFGMLLFEIVGRRKNTVSTSSEIVDWFPKVVLDKYQNGELAELIKSYGIKKEDMEKAERMSSVALWCVQDSPGARPPMSAVERIFVEEVLEQLKCTRTGLTSEEGVRRLQVFGPNKLEEKKESKILKFLGFMWNPFSWVMEAAAIMAFVMANWGGRPPSWLEFVGIVVLLLINSTISFIEENKAGNAAAALMAGLAPKTKVLRDGRWSQQDASILVPGDIITIKLGDIIPADARLLEGDPLKIDQSALTGESLPVTKNPSDVVFSGSICKQGEIEAVVIATGVHSFLGKAKHLVESTNQVGHFRKALTAIGNFYIYSIFVGIYIEAVFMFMIQQRGFRDFVDNLLVLLIGGTPIAMPTMLSVTMATGSQRLSQQGAITKRRTAIEELARMDVLCSDKTGTLTLNKLTVERNLTEVFVEGIEMDQVILHAARASRTENQDAIDAAVVGMLADPKEARAGIREVHFLPFNPVDKRTALTYIDSNGNWHRASKGAPEQILDLCNSKGDVRKKVHTVIDEFAERGLKSLAVAIQEIPEKTKDSSGKPWQLIGLLPLFDPPRHDSAETIRMAKVLGVDFKMITGDQLAIAEETGRRLGMGTNMHPSSSLLFEDKDALMAAAFPINEFIETVDGFAGVLPEHKYEIIRMLQERKHICGVTGDGDATALKKADIGIAVANASDAARSAADIFLTEPGLNAIISAVLTSRAVYQRMQNYIVSYILVYLCWHSLVPCFMEKIDMLGSGAYGDVYEGHFPNGVKIAVKLLKEKYEGAAKKQFMAEIGTIGRTNHINLVRLYGFCYDRNTIALVYEFMENGSLDNYLFGKKEMIEWEKLHAIAVGTAKGIAYLHEECQQRIIHYDIKPANILLDANFLPKVADFGLAKLCNRDSTHDSVTGFKGTFGYSAPEFFMGNHPITYKCDVYSFGMLLFEIVGMIKNKVSGSSESLEWFPKVVLDKYQKGELAELIKSYGIKKEDMEKAERMSLVALWCAQDSPRARPRMSAVVKMLEGGVEIMPPPKPTHSLFGKTAVKPPNAAADSSSSSSEESNANWYKETTAIMAKYEIEVAIS